MISLANPSSLTRDSKIRALSMILKMKEEEQTFLKEYLNRRKHLIYLDSIKRNRNQRRSRVISSNDKRFNE